MNGRDRNPLGSTVDATPFDFVPHSDHAKRAAVLCLHGLTGTPYEVRPVAEALCARGFRAQAIDMAGHAGSVDELARSTREEWVEQARAAFLALRRDYARVFLVGVSMGGLVSLRLAQTEAVDGLVVVGVPLALAPPIPQVVPLLRLVKKARKKRGSDIQDPAARARHPGLPAMPLDSVVELMRLQGEVVPELDRIRAPILIAHGVLDRTARPRDARRLHEGVASPDKELFFLSRSGHVATVDHDGPALARAAADFLSRRI